jgi:hypothetical protein
MKRLLVGAALIAATAVTASMPAAAQDAPTVALVHGIPGVPVDVFVDGQAVLTGFEPGTVQDVSGLAGQTLADVEIRAAGTPDVVIGPVAELDVPDTGSTSIVAHLDEDGTPTITVFENNTNVLPGGFGRLTIRHAAAVPPVDLVAGDARPVEDLENGGSMDLELQAGTITGAQIVTTDGEPVAEVPTLELAQGASLIVYVVGSPDDGTLTFYTEEHQLGMDGEQAVTDDGTADAGTEDGGTTDEAATDEAGGMTPAPTAVNSGAALPSSSDAVLLFAAALCLAAVSGGALVLRRRTTGEPTA